MLTLYGRSKQRLAPEFWETFQLSLIPIYFMHFKNNDPCPTSSSHHSLLQASSSAVKHDRLKAKSKKLSDLEAADSSSESGEESADGKAVQANGGPQEIFLHRVLYLKVKVLDLICSLQFSNGSFHHKSPWTGVQKHEETGGFPLESKHKDLAADVQIGKRSP